MSKLDKQIADKIIIGRIVPQIYAFCTNTIPNYVKVGDTYRPVTVRLNEWKQYFENPIQLFVAPATVNQNVFFRDYAVHRYLENDLHKYRLQKKDISNNIYYSHEFFKDITEKDLLEAIKDIKKAFALKTFKYSFYNAETLQPTHIHYEREKNWKLRENQKIVVENFEKALQKGNTNLLMYAVMRFGKSYTSLCCARKMNAKSVIIVSAKADVCEEWKKTVQTATGFDDYLFVTTEDLIRNNKLLTQIKAARQIPVLFLTLQDLQGPFIKNKHREVFSSQFDLLIIDETHFGARAEKFGEVLRPKNKETNKYDREEWVDAEQARKDIDKYLRAKVKLHLSGTPYRILMGGEFNKEQIIAFCQFSDIIESKNQAAKHLLQKENANEWDNPYYGFPEMIRFAFNPNETAQHRIKQLEQEGQSSSFSLLFRTQSIAKSSDGLHKKFIYEKEVLDFLKIIDGSQEDPNILSFLNYDKIKEGNMCRHIVMVLPYCSSCDALEALINAHRDEFVNLNKYKIINISGLDKPNLYKNTQEIKACIEKNENKNQKTITLTVNRMLTGSTVPQWDTMIYLKDTASPQEYDQAIFRLQNPYIRVYKDSKGNNIKYDMKPQTLLVDFNPNRMFRLQELKAQYYNVNTEKAGNSKLAARIQKELEISPILFINKNKIEQVTPANIMAAVSEYSKNRGVLEETNEIPVDFNLLQIEPIKQIIINENILGEKGGLSLKGFEGTGTDYESGSIGKHDMPSDEESKSSRKGNKEINSKQMLEKKFRTYYSRILFFAFLSSNKLKSLEDIIACLKSPDNRRIAAHLGLQKDILSLIQMHIDKFVLSKLDYKIQNINTLSTDTNALPLERAKVAIKKFGRLGESEVITPLSVCRNMVNLIPNTAFLKAAQKQYKMLDLASKTGEFAIALFEKFIRLNIDMKQIKDLIYAIPTSGVTYEFTRKIYEILGLNIANIAERFDTYQLLLIKNGKEIDINKLKKILTQNKSFNEISLFDPPLEGEKTMKFEAIVGNPPYQEIISSEKGNKSLGKQLFPSFIEMSTQLAEEFVSLITPSRWFTSDAQDSSFITLRKFIKENNHFRTIAVLNNNKNLFPDVELSGLAYFLYDRSYIGNTTFIDKTGNKDTVSTRPLFEDGLDIIIPLDSTVRIMNLVRHHDGFKTLMEITCGRNAFGIVGKRDILEKITTTCHTKNSIKVYCAHQEVRYTSVDYVTKNIDLMKKWKVFISKGNGGAGLLTDNKPVNILGKSLLGEPDSVCSDSLIPIGKFNTKAEAVNLQKYLSTRFVRYMVGILKVSQNISQNVYLLVPMQDFSSRSDIDWEKSIAEIDAQLFSKYNLSAADINMIEAKIKPME